MKKKLWLIIILILVIALSYFGYKIYLLNNYKVNINDQLIEKIKQSGEVVKIQASNDTATEKVQFKEVIYKSFDEKFLLKELPMFNNEEYVTYYLDYVDVSNFKAMFRVGRASYISIYNVLTSDDITTFGFGLEDFKNINRKKLLQKYDIKDDVDAIKYFIYNSDKKLNVFSSSDKIKMNYFIKKMVQIIMPLSEIKIIDGDFKGYMYILNIDNNFAYELHLMYKGDNYVFLFLNGKDGEYFNLDNIYKFISNVRFKN